MSAAHELSDEWERYAESTKQVIGETFDSYNGSIDRLRHRISNLEAYRNRVGLGGAWHGDDDHAELNKALRSFIRHGDASGFSQKAMSVGSDPHGGYWVDAGLSSSITRTIFETSPIRQIARIVQVDSEAFEEILDRNEAGASWVSETESRPETTTPEIGKSRIPANELYAAPRITQQLLDDAKVDLVQWISDKISDKLSRTENTAFVSGNGVGRPRGFLSYTAVTTADATRAWDNIQYIPSGASGSFTSSNSGDALLSLQFSLKAGYRQNAVWLMNSSTLAAVRKLKDGQGNYLWQQSVIASEPSLLLGHKVVVAEDMPSVSANSLSIAFGDFGRGYTIVDRVPMRMLRDPFTSKPYVIFYVYKRTGCDLVNSEAIKVLKMAAS